MPGVWEGKIQVFLGLDTLIKATGEATYGFLGGP